jgi:hypothetical protein
MITVVRRGALVGFFVVCVACGDQARPTGPSPNPAPPAPPPPVTVTPFPPLSGAATTYRFAEALENFGAPRVREFTTGSSFVLYDTGGFYLQYEALAHRYRGRYQQDAGQLSLYFSEQSTSADAIGILKGSRLEVRYSEMMQHSDFENAVYQRVE